MRCVLPSSGVLLRRIIWCMERYGYWYYKTGWIPEPKDPARTDEKILRAYAVPRSRMGLHREGKKGRAKLRYYRTGRFFVLLATDGGHPFFEGEKPDDVRNTPLRYNGFTISSQGGEIHLRWSADVYRKLRRMFLDRALEATPAIEARFKRLRHPHHPDIITQKRKIMRAVHKRRRKAGRSRIAV